MRKRFPESLKSVKTVALSIMPLLLAALTFKWQARSGKSALFLQIAHAQSQSPLLTISKSASPDPVVAGGELTYIITVTNTGDVPLQGVVVTEALPEGTVAHAMDGLDGQWAMHSADGGSVLVWEARAPLPPAQPMRLKCIVLVDHGHEQPVINDDYKATVKGWDSPVIGLPVMVRVVSPTPTITPRPSPTPTPMPPTLIPTFTATPTPGPTTPTPVLLPTPVPVKSSTSQMGLLLGGIVVIAVLIPFIAWSTRSKGRRR